MLTTSRVKWVTVESDKEYDISSDSEDEGERGGQEDERIQILTCRR